MTQAREQAVTTLKHADLQAGKSPVAKDSGLLSALTGIGYALVYIGDAIREKYEPPF